MQKQSTRAWVPLGRVVATPGALEALEEAELMSLLRRHQAGDWGEVGKQDWEENELSLREGYRLLSSYTAQRGRKVWIITEADRSVTTFLLPEEY
jgi:hypothetical protein